MSADGAWKTTINSPMGVQEGTLEIHTSGDAFTGKMEGRMGAQDISGKVDGDTLTWSAAITNPFPMTLEFTVKVDGDAMTGSVKAGAFGSSPLTGVRA
ncbi:MAG: hypothetical protein JOZ27_00375 [Caulobacteraceae bacterium]|nr:hypothetical protein [Caulobacteraceae bacterium]